jgi:hypothetical protein
MDKLASQYGWHKPRQKALHWRDGGTVPVPLAAIRVVRYWQGSDPRPRSKRVGIRRLATVDRHNGFAKTGCDLYFDKGRSTFNRYNGDASVTPNPCLAPIARSPFFALQIRPATLGMSWDFRRTVTHGCLIKTGRHLSAYMPAEATWDRSCAEPAPPAE